MFFGERKGRGAGVWSFGCKHSLNTALFKILLTLGEWMVLSISLPPALLSCHTRCQQEAPPLSSPSFPPGTCDWSSSSHLLPASPIPAPRAPSQRRNQAVIWLPAPQQQSSFEYLCKEGLNLWDLARAVTVTHSVSEQGRAFPAAGLCTALLPPSSPFHMHEMDFTHTPQPSWPPDLTNEQRGPVEREQRAWSRLCSDISPTQQNVTPTGSEHGPRFQRQPWFALLERGCTQTLPATWRKTRARFAEQAEGLANTPEKLNNGLI